MQLDKYQEEIANDFIGKIAVVAGPGSGKTRTLIERAERIFYSGEEPQSILLISYTNKVRSEIKRRLRERDLELEKVNVHTFHSFGVFLLRLYGSLVGINKNFEVIDDEDAKRILNKIYTELGISKTDYPVKKTLVRLSEIYDKKRESFNNSDAFVGFLNSLLPPSIINSDDVYEDIFSYYTYYKRNNNYLDFDDILSYTNALFYKDEAQRIVQRIKYVMVDEAQDLDNTQYELISLLEDSGISNILLVGDFDQNIYSWRGARTDLFRAFYSEAKKYSLGVNYRSTPAIVKLSRNLIEKNGNRIDIDLVSNVSDSPFTPICNFFGSSDAELNWVSERIQELTNKDVEPTEIAILYRANYLSRPIEGELIKKNIKYVIYNGFEFYQRKEVKDCISLLKLLVNRSDRIALERCVLNLPNIGPKKSGFVLNDNLEKLSSNDCQTVEQFYSVLDKASDLELISSKLQYMVEQLQYKDIWDDGNLEERLENYSELLRFIETFDDETIELQEFLDNISLLNKRDERTNLNECIKLMTLHSSKGLEFRFVFIINALDGIIPNDRSIAEDLLEEERRLMYVGITRAKEQLYITASPFFGYTAAYDRVSRFVKEAGININDSSTRDPLYVRSIHIQQETSSKSKVRPDAKKTDSNPAFNITEILLTVLLGWIGIHCFYRKQYIKGIIYLFTLGLFGIGWFIDIVLLLVRAIKSKQ